MIRPYQLILLFAITLAFILNSFPLFGGQNWRLVAGGKRFNISGMAFIDQKNGRTSFLVVQDHKHSRDGRAGLLTISRSGTPHYQPVAWPENLVLPHDLEALSTVPGRNHQFLAADSDGTVYHVALNETRTALSLIARFEFPSIMEEPNYEGFSVQQIEDQLLAVWASRGRNEEPALLAWSTLDLTSRKFGQVTTQTLTAPWPVAAEVRHISDLKVDNAGTLYTAATSDPGNSGPFQSAAYASGTFSPAKEGFTFRPNPIPLRLKVARHNKAEAIELVPGAHGGLVLGSDDENVGGSIDLGW